MSKKKEGKDWLKDFHETHGEIYKYPGLLINPLEKGAKTKIKIVCKKHGEFEQACINHKIGNGCPQCGRERSEAAKYTSTKEYLEKFKEVHGDKYKCLDEKLTSNKKARFECEEHGIFLQTPSQHAQGRGCPKCGRS